MSNLANNENEELALINIAAFMVPVILAAGAAAGRAIRAARS